MTSVLLIDDEPEWLGLIRRALPEYDVDQAQSFDAALALLNGDTMYDVAIVDLNLLAPRSDGLGGVLLEIMRNQYPSIRRIALTGMHPTAVKEVLDQYGVDDLLLKDINIDLAAVRKVVEKALEGTAGDIPRDLRTEQSNLRTSADSWKENIMLELDQRAPTLRNDVLAAQSVGKTAEGSERELAALNSRRERIEAEYSDLKSLISGIRNNQDLAHASEKFEELKKQFSS